MTEVSLEKMKSGKETKALSVTSVNKHHQQLINQGLARLVRGLATNPEDMNSIPQTDMARETQSLQVVL